ncbi:hypothetical protein [Corynebacterium dentalis]
MQALFSNVRDYSPQLGIPRGRAQNPAKLGCDEDKDAEVGALELMGT